MLRLMLLLRLNWLLHFKYQYSQKLSLLKQARFCSVIKVLVYISPKIYIFFLKKEIYISHFLVPFLLTLLTIHLVFILFWVLILFLINDLVLYFACKPYNWRSGGFGYTLLTIFEYIYIYIYIKAH